MKNQFQKDRPGIVNKKVFYVALGICLLAVGVALYIGVTGTMQELERDKTMNLSQASSQAPTDNDDAENANEDQANVPVVEPTQDVPRANTENEKSTPSQPKENQAKEPDKGNTTQAFARPLEGEIINGFSDGELVKSKTLMEWRTHDGVDIKAAANTPVKSVSDGKIEDIIEDTMWGVCVVISHDNNYQSMYYGLKPNVPVKKGADIKLGDIVGYVGNTAEIEIAEESHLHFGMKKDDKWIDPMKLFK